MTRPVDTARVVTKLKVIRDVVIKREFYTRCGLSVAVGGLTADIVRGSKQCRWRLTA